VEPTEIFDDNYDYIVHNSESEIIKQKLQYLNSLREKLSYKEYTLLKANVLYRSPINTPGMVEYYLKTKLKGDGTEAAKLLTDKIQRFL